MMAQASDPHESCQLCRHIDVARSIVDRHEFTAYGAAKNPELVSAIFIALREAVAAEKERCADLLVKQAEAYAFEANLHSDPSRVEMLMAKGQAVAELSAATRASP